MQRSNAGFRTQSGTMLKNPATGEIKHIPPQHIDDINRLMLNLEKYINDDLDELDPLIRLAVIHYQFETIHPFYDGNGRTGRIINVLYLTHKKLLDLPILYLSAYIIKNKSKYYELLENVSKSGEWSEWIEYMLNGIEHTAKTSVTLIKEIDDAIRESVEKKLNISRQTASKYLKICEKLGAFKCVKLGRINYFVNLRLFEILKRGLVL